MAALVTPPPSSLWGYLRTSSNNNDHIHCLLAPFRAPQLRHRLRATRKFSSYPQEGDNLAADPRNWSRNRSVVTGDYDNDGPDDEDDDDEDDGDDDRSLDLLVRFVQNVFRKISKRARKAVRSVLPISISTKLVVCTLGSAVFVSILLIRGVWSGLSYLQDSRSLKVDDVDNDQRAWTGAQPVT